MKVPRLNRRLTLESPARIADGAGGFSESWTALGVHWAAVLPRTGKESTAIGATIASVSYRIVVRAAPMGSAARPEAEQRFRDGSRLFRISAVTEHDPNGRYLVCFATEEVAT